ncbi:MAG: glycosyltransferase family 2 protein [Patescibacteria group bacterium]|nr:glycosyltransferase family 2 protein [Patescibacteria group bacterium]
MSALFATAIVPAYNEAKRIGVVLEVLIHCKCFNQIIVIDDGSRDGALKAVTKYPVECHRLTVNKGKGKAMDIGVKLAKNQCIFFCDADLKGLNKKIVMETVMPVLMRQADMSIALRPRTLYALHRLNKYIPILEGQRALTKSLWRKLPEYYKQGYRIEAGLNAFASYFCSNIKYRVFPGLDQTVKESKHGILRGTVQRWRMHLDILRAYKQFFLHDRRLIMAKRPFWTKGKAARIYQTGF